MLNQRRLLAVLTAAFLLGAWQAALADDPPYYVRQGTWQDTMMASREAKAAQPSAATSDVPAASPKVPGVEFGPWYKIGPFYPEQGSGFAVAFPPEQEIDLSKTYGKCRWVQQPSYVDGVVHEMQAGAAGSTYLYRTITAAAPVTVTAHFGSDDGLVVWLNGKRLISKDVPRGAAPGQDSAKLELQQGENRLLLKIYNITGQHGFYFSVGDKPVSARRPSETPHEELWRLVARDFRGSKVGREMKWEKEDGIWTADWQPRDYAALAQRYAAATRGALAAKAKELASTVKTAAGLRDVRKIYHQSREVDEAVSMGGGATFESVRLAITDLVDTFGAKYPKGRELLTRLDALEKAAQAVQSAAESGDAAAGQKLASLAADLLALQQEALLANPLIDFDKILVVKRHPRRMGLPQNWQGNSSIGATGYDNEIALMSVRPPCELKTLYRPPADEFVGDLDLHFDGDRLLFSMPGPNKKFQVYEIRIDGTGLRQVTPGEHPDVDNYDGCYLPDGRVIFCSTACYLGVPCVGGSDHVGSLYLLGTDGKTVRQLTFDQDHSWCPTMLPNGRVLYTRWEYSDTPHYFTRMLFEMNPDGTAQFEHYGSNSYWPNSIFYARPIPGSPTKVVAIISGHHGTARAGELLILDTAKGRHEASGVVQRIPGYGKIVEPTIADGLVEKSWPKFLHPYPLSDKYFLVACKKDPAAQWAIYLVDVFDNMVLLREEPGYALLEPVPVRKTSRPPVIPDKVKPDRKDATVYLVDVYQGKGLAGVPRGTIKRLRVYTNHYAYRGMGGHIDIGIDGPWDAKRILGTVPVYEDGSALFRVPANVPIVVQPLDSEGRAVQVMRSWYTAMPGEIASCVGCHEPQSTSPPARRSIATARGPVDIEPWYGPARPFSFEREVQPVLTRYCVSCHNGAERPDGRRIPDLRSKQEVAAYKGRWTPAYEALHRFVRRPGPESDYHLPVPGEWHASTSELVQMLKKGHHNVTLDAEAWDRLYTWIDLNVPCHGTWSEYRAIAGNNRQRRLELMKQYANLEEDPESYPAMPAVQVVPVKPAPEAVPAAAAPACPGWPFDATEAVRRQAAGGPPMREIDLGGVKLELVRVPAGEFVMGDAAGLPDERPATRVAITTPFWMSKYEITNQQYALFDPSHDSGYISWFNKDQDRRGEPANGAKQPVIRVSWQRAMAFCQWLSARTKQKFTLPTEAQWEYACRAGTATAMSYGAVDADFTRFANFADQRISSLARRDSPKWIPCVDSLNDGDVVTAAFDRHQPNAWGLCDMHGNVAEWTRTTYRPYPYRTDDGRDDGRDDGEKVVRGGSFYDRPARGRSAFRLSYPPWRAVFNVGFRVVVEGDLAPQLAGRPETTGGAQ